MTPLNKDQADASILAIVEAPDVEAFVCTLDNQYLARITQYLQKNHPTFPGLIGAIHAVLEREISRRFISTHTPRANS